MSIADLWNIGLKALSSGKISTQNLDQLQEVIGRDGKVDPLERQFILWLGGLRGDAFEPGTRDVFSQRVRQNFTAIIGGALDDQRIDGREMSDFIRLARQTGPIRRAEVEEFAKSYGRFLTPEAKKLLTRLLATTRSE